MKSQKNDVEINHLKSAFERTDKAVKAIREYIYNNEIPEGFSSTYQGLTQNDLKEEYLVHLFSSYFTDIDSSAVTDTMDSIDWETVVKKIFKLPEDLNDSEVMRLMNDTIRNMLSSTEDSFTYSEIFKENKFQQLTKLAALKKELMKNNTLREEC